jgi:hypothetical protein
MPTISSRPQRWIGAGLALALALLLLGPAPAWAAGAEPGNGSAVAYRCDGDPLEATYNNGPVDAPGIPNTQAGTVPGAFVLLLWRDIRLQLPRTNNAGAPSYTDGKWWWSLEDLDHPRFLLRQGDVVSFVCERPPI